MSRQSSRSRKKSTKKRKQPSRKFCVGDKLLVSYIDQELQGTLHFHGPVNDGKRGLVNMYGIELGEGEGASDGTYNQSERVYFSTSSKKSAVFLKSRYILKVLTPINGKRLCVEDRVLVQGRGNGVIKFVGPTYFGPHLWYGIKLDKKIGRNDGMVKNRRYFECPPKQGVFVREEKLTPLDKHDRPINLLSKWTNKTRQEMANDLFEACAKGEIKIVRQILTVDKTVAALARDNNTDATALMTACYHGYYDVAQELLQTKKIIDINEQNYHGMTALHMAAQAGYDKICELLLKFVIHIDATTEDGTTALFNAVEKGHIKVVATLLENGAEANLSSRDNESPLIQACHRGHSDIVKLLLKAPNIKINQKRKTDGATALFVACREGASECVKHLLTNNLLFINESKTNGRSPLFIASFFGHNEIVEMLIQHSHKMAQQRMNHGVLDVNQCDSKGFTPLFVAAQNGHTKIVTLLLQNNADVNQAEQRGHTPLWISALRGHVDVVRVLLSHPHIDIDYKDLSGVTALWAACQNNNSEVVELLLHPRNVVVETQIDKKTHQRKVSLTNKKGLFDDKNNLGIAAMLKKAAIDEDESNDDVKDDDSDASLSPLEDDGNDGQQHSRRNPRRGKKSSKKKKKGHLNNPNGTEMRKGANPNLAKHDGCTPLWIAASRGNSQCMEPLINYGADLNKPDRSQGATPLFVACQNGKKLAVDLLLAANADVNRPRSGDGTTPLMMAAHNGHAAIVDVLLKSGADPMQANTTGLNALGCAAMQGHSEIVKLAYQHLLNVKNPQEIVDFVNAGDGVNGWTPLHLACMGGHENVIKYLINTVKVDIFKKDYENKTGLEHAWQNGHQTIVSWLSQLEHQYSRL